MDGVGLENDLREALGQLVSVCPVGSRPLAVEQPGGVMVSSRERIVALAPVASG